MIICFKFGNVEHCYVIPVIVIPVGPHGPGPGPVNYPELIRDATILASLQAAANNVSDAGVRNALSGGINTAIEALQRRAGSHVVVRETAGGPPTGGGAHGPGPKD